MKGLRKALSFPFLLRGWAQLFPMFFRTIQFPLHPWELEGRSTLLGHASLFHILLAHPATPYCPMYRKNVSCSPVFCQRNGSRKKKICIFIPKQIILNFSRLLKTSDSYLDEKIIITSHRDVPKPLCCNCMIRKFVLFTSGSGSVYLQHDRIWIPNLVTY